MTRGEWKARDSKDPDGAVLLCDRAGVAAFIAVVKAGQFDLP